MLTAGGNEQRNFSKEPSILISRAIRFACLFFLSVCLIYFLFRSRININLQAKVCMEMPLRLTLHSILANHK